MNICWRIWIESGLDDKLYLYIFSFEYIYDKIDFFVRPKKRWDRKEEYERRRISEI